MEGLDLQDAAQVITALQRHRSVRGISRATGLPYTTTLRAVHRAQRELLDPAPPSAPQPAPADDIPDIGSEADCAAFERGQSFDALAAPAISRGAGRDEDRAARRAQDNGDAVLVFSDAHARRNGDRRRFMALGRFIADTRPRGLVDLGDFGDFTAALRAHHDGGDPCGDDLLMDFDAARLAREDLTAWHKPPLLLACEGNHEEIARRICARTRAIPSSLYEQHVASPARLAGWRVERYGTPVELDGVYFCHAFMGQGRRKLGGEHVASTLVRRLHASAVCGDTHRWDGPWAERTLDGRTAIGLCVGTFQDPRPTDTRAWAGCALLHRLEHGRFDVEQVSLDWLLANYGRR